jgi:hypothetical protein
MNDWSRVKWTEAGQVAAVLNWESAGDEDALVSPRVFFTRLREAGRRAEAVHFLSQALPRYESVGWAARMVRDLVPGAPPRSAEGDSLKAALLWLQDPSDGRRRAAWQAAERARDDSPERLAALAVFFSGGSIAPADCPPVPAPKTAAGRFAAGAVLLGAIRSGDQARALDQALDAGDAIAVRGLETDAG